MKKGFPAYLEGQPKLEGLKDFASRFGDLWMNHFNDGGNLSYGRKRLRLHHDRFDGSVDGVVYLGHIISASSYANGLIIDVDTMNDAPLQRPNRQNLRELLAEDNHIWRPQAEWGVNRVMNKFGNVEVLNGEDFKILVEPVKLDESYEGKVGQYWFSFFRVAGHPLSKVLWPV